MRRLIWRENGLEWSAEMDDHLRWSSSAIALRRLLQQETNRLFARLSPAYGEPASAILQILGDSFKATEIIDDTEPIDLGPRVIH